jgi:redox-sensitive bicupin YhaK (pirin superfamily)
MITVRPGHDRGRTHLDWLDSRHTFSFGDYHDPNHVSFRSLRVLNEDWIAPGSGFGMHPHRDMEIVTVVLQGALRHRDSLGTGSTIRPGEVQRMTAGTGILHSELNPSATEPVHLLQIWMLPERRGLEPGYEQRRFGEDEAKGRLRLVASRDGRDGAVTVHQEVDLYLGRLETGERLAHRLKPGRHAWVQVARGALTLNRQTLLAGDGAAVSDESVLELRANEGPAEALLFDLA